MHIRKNVGLLGLIVTIFLVLLGAYLLFPRKIIQNPLSQGLMPTPFPSPFNEMTIPYLRSRNYQSKLGSLDQISSNANYTLYLTGYDSDGLKVNGLLTIPAGKSPPSGWPAIVFVHGYIAPASYQTLGNYTDYVDYLSRHGFVVFKIDLRGHGDSEGSAGGGYYGSDYIVDTLNARAALEKADFVNPDGIGLWGHSMAGNVVLRSMVARTTIPAVVIWAGAVYTYEDQRKYGINDNSYRPPVSGFSIARSRRQELFDKVGSPSAESPFWKQVAPTNFLNDLKGAIQLNHAVDDDVVNIGYSRDLNSLLDKTRVPHELNEYPGGGHNISGASFDLAMQNTVEFFKKYLKKQP